MIENVISPSPKRDIPASQSLLYPAPHPGSQGVIKSSCPGPGKSSQVPWLIMLTTITHPIDSDEDRIDENNCFKLPLGRRER